MNLNQLKIFYLVVKRGSLTAAARELNITQPAVTKAIRRLQEHYEIRLVERPGKKLVLTEAGKALHQIADRIFALEARAEDCLRRFREGGDRHLRIHASETFGGYYLPELIDRFKRSHPEINVSVDILPNEKVAEHTASLLNDLGFISLPIRHKKLVVREVLTERLILIAAPTHSLARKKALHPRDLQGHPIIMHEPGSALQKAMDDLIGRGEGNGSPYLEFSNNEAIKRAVAAGTGIALISERAAGEEVRTGRLVALRLSRPPMTRQFYMVHHRAKIMTPALSRLMEMVAQWAFDTNSHHGRRILSHEPQSAEDILHGR